jgi:hypothetical protein
MPTLYETLSLERQLQLAVRTNSPARLAQAFAAHAGQFYDRAGFDRLAREAGALYQARGPAEGAAFRARLDRRLRDRDRAPVVWGTDPSGRAA